MRRFWSLRLLVACLVVLSTSAPTLASTIGWFCDGRLCGAWLCCCEQPDQAKTDENCRKTETSTDGRQLCAAECGCTPVYSPTNDLADTLKPAIVSVSAPLLALVPPPALWVPAVYQPLVPVSLPDYRGPPPAPLVFPAIGLRGPPAS